MKRIYHGCEIESTPGCTEEGTDGWSHIVRRDGATVGETITLGEAIRLARRSNETAPPANEIPEDIEETDE